ncbi:MAG: YdeI/OmpD-associated family protein [Planctomycetaceae bacterium]
MQTVEVADRAAWRRWLRAHHASSTGVWVLVRKKGGAPPGATYVEVVEEGLCFGWIDSRANPVDEHHYRLTMTPRKSGSVWSASNKERVARLTAEGRMTSAGLAVVEAAKADGSWDALSAVDALEVPEDLAAALAADPAAARHFDAFPPSSKKMILYWIASAKRPQTRARRVEETARLAAENLRANQPQRREPGR